MSNHVENVLQIRILRPPFVEYFTLELANGQTEELEPEECRAWFKARGANMDVVEKALDQAWNFYRALLVIHNPKMPKTTQVPFAPDI